MERKDLETFKPVIDLIPQVIKLSKKCVDEELNEFTHDLDRIKFEREFLKNEIKLIQGKWLIDIMYCARILGDAHFNDLKHILTGISSRVLTDKLKFLVKRKILERRAYKTRPIRVTYNLTKFGENLYHLMVPILIYNLHFKVIDKDEDNPQARK
jgi:DNA-binding HxlR family transcriptional regulator